MKTKRWTRYLKADIPKKTQNTYVWLIVFLALCMLPSHVASGNERVHIPQHLAIEEDTTEVSLTVEPEFPIVGEATKIIASGTWHNSCVPQFDSQTLSLAFGGIDIDIQAITSEEEACLDVITAWSMAVPIVFEQSAETNVHFTIANDKVENLSTRGASTYFFVHDGITFQSPRPQIDESVKITISGWTMSCVPIYQSHTIIGQTIAINIGVPEWAEVCGQSVGKWVETLDIDPLSAGIYRVEAYVRMINDKSYKLLHATNLIVGEPNYQIFMPIIKAEQKPSRSQPCIEGGIRSSDCY